MNRQKTRNTAQRVHPPNRRSRSAPQAAGIAGAAIESMAPSAKPQQLSVFDRYLTVWVFLCIVAGIGLGRLFPAAFYAAGRLQVAKINLPVAGLIWLMIIPMLLKVDLKALKGVVKHWRGVGVTLFVNWGVKPFSMALLGWLFIGQLFRLWLPADQIDAYIAGLILLAAAPCTAMVFVWSHLSHGEPHFTLSQVALNDVIMVFAFAPIVGVLLGLSAITVPWDTLLLSVLLYIVVPLMLAHLWRAIVLRQAHGYARLNRLLKTLHPVSLTVLLVTLVLLFGFQGGQILAQPLVILLLAVPILIQVFFNAGLAYLLNRAVRSPHCVAGPSALIGASNFFELAVATAIALFGFESGAALATVVGVLIEVPVMLLAVGVVNRSRTWYERRSGVPGYEECCPADACLHVGR
jgi:ACR3 family arsenite transporter